jgi:hypothetical protein
MVCVEVDRDQEEIQRAPATQLPSQWPGSGGNSEQGRHGWIQHSLKVEPTGFAERREEHGSQGGVRVLTM